MTDGSGYFGIPPWEELDDDEIIPEVTTGAHFPDGSSIILLEFEDPIVTGKRNCTAREVARWIEENEADIQQSIEYIKKNYKI